MLELFTQPLSGKSSPKKYQSNHIAEKLAIRHQDFCIRLLEEFSDIESLIIYQSQLQGGRPQKILLLEQLHLFNLPLLFPRNEISKELFRNLLAELFHDPIQEIKLPSALEIGRAYVASLEKIDALTTQLLIAEPKINAFNALMDTKDTITIKQFAKVLGSPWGQNKLFAELRQLKILGSIGALYNLPFQKYIESGYFEVIETDIRNGKEIHCQTVVTPKGQAWLLKRLGGLKNDIQRFS